MGKRKQHASEYPAAAASSSSAPKAKSARIKSSTVGMGGSHAAAAEAAAETAAAAAAATSSSAAASASAVATAPSNAMSGRTRLNDLFDDADRMVGEVFDVEEEKEAHHESDAMVIARHNTDRGGGAACSNDAAASASDMELQRLMRDSVQAASKIGPSIKLLQLLSVPADAPVVEFKRRADLICPILQNAADSLDPSLPGFTPAEPSLLHAIFGYVDKIPTLEAGGTETWRMITKALYACHAGLVARWDPEIRGLTGETILFLVIAANPVYTENSMTAEFIRSYMERGVDINGRNSHGENMLHAYLRNPTLDLTVNTTSAVFQMYFLHRHGLDLNAIDSLRGDTALHVIVRQEIIVLLPLLVESEYFMSAFDLFCPNFDGVTPRQLADLMSIENPQSTARRDIAHILRICERHWNDHHRPVLRHALCNITPLIPDLADIVIAYCGS